MQSNRAEVFLSTGSQLARFECLADKFNLREGIGSTSKWEAAHFEFSVAHTRALGADTWTVTVK